ncbi:hypothetical protein K525DRAFT_275705 [Schizophyllum commune Loenen D]|nr:hypothetical protein K525DRAFT_275705 [Schizophyllum commune Loenen D]
MAQSYPSFYIPTDSPKQASANPVARKSTRETNVLDFYRTYTAGWQRLAGDDIKVIIKTLRWRKVLGVKL